MGVWAQTLLVVLSFFVILVEPVVGLIMTILSICLVVRLNRKEAKKSEKIRFSFEPVNSDCEVERKAGIEDTDGMDGDEFEDYVGELFEKLGFKSVEVTQYNGDYGIDIIATGEFAKYAIQCKRWNGHVGVHAIQEALAGKGYYEAHVAMVVTNSYFTNQAKELARKVGVVLVDRDRLSEMIVAGNE